MLQNLKKILIANRGEIACRIARTAQRLGIRVVAVYSDVDAKAKHVAMADEAYYIGAAAAQESYLRGDKIIEVAVKSNAQAIHPGYGFLSESADFAQACAESGLTFIGPPPSAIRAMGVKSTSKQIMVDAGVAVVPGYHGENQSAEYLAKEASRIGFPLMIKAVRGGGGKGMRIARTAADFLPSLESAKRESLSSFGDDSVLLEKYVERSRHVEVQVFADTHGQAVHLFDRDCSIQRRHQKVLEMAPAPGLSNETRHKLGEAGVRAAKAVGYVGAGTVEFIYDTSDDQFYFMEMNTRLQVEHPVTEMVTGVDLVDWQLRVAAGEPLPMEQQDLRLNGASVEARVYAETPSSDGTFVPCSGHLHNLRTPTGSDRLRIESGVEQGDDVSVYYDPMIAKVVVWEPKLSEALISLNNALSQFNIVGVDNNIDFLRRLSTHVRLLSQAESSLHTDFIPENKQQLFPETLESERTTAQAALALLLLRRSARVINTNDPFSIEGAFRVNDASHGDIVQLVINDKECHVVLKERKDGWWNIELGDVSFTARGHMIPTDSGFFRLHFELQKESISTVDVTFSPSSIHIFTKDTSYKFRTIDPNEVDYVESAGNVDDSSEMAVARSPMPGTVEKVSVTVGDRVQSGDQLAVVIAMKMEHVIKATIDGIVESVHATQGETVSRNDAIVKVRRDTK